MHLFERDVLRNGLPKMVKRFASNISGAIMPLFVFSLLAMIVALGLALDYGYALNLRTRMQNAADASALAAATEAARYLATTTGDAASVSKAIDFGKNYAQGLFVANMPNNTPADTKLNLTVTYVAGQFRASGTVKGTLSTMFMPLASIKTVPVGVKAAAGADTTPYREMTLLLDISQSMGLAATDDDMKKLFDKTFQANGEGCTFGCHVSLRGGLSNEEIAEKNGIVLRVDSLRDAVRNLFKTAANSGSGYSYRFAINTSSTAITQTVALTNNYTTLDTAAKAIDLGPTNTGGPGDSYWPMHLYNLTQTIGKSGNGSSQSNPYRYLVLVTDGVWDYPDYSCTFGHCTGVIDPNYCKGLKDNGVQVAVIYTTYLPVYKDPRSTSSGFRPEYEGLVAPFAASIPTSLKSCASPYLFFEAKNGPEIDTAFQNIFNYTKKVKLLN